MKVKELVKILSKFDPELEVTITDGYEVRCYHTNGIVIDQFEDLDGSVCVDVGIGGCDIKED
jgi:hypothetical protein